MPEIENWQVCGIDLESALKIFSCTAHVLFNLLTQCLSALPPPRFGNIIPIFRNGKREHSYTYRLIALIRFN